MAEVPEDQVAAPRVGGTLTQDKPAPRAGILRGGEKAEHNRDGSNATNTDPAGQETSTGERPRATDGGMAPAHRSIDPRDSRPRV